MKSHRIESKDNALLKAARKLHSPRNCLKSGQTLAEGAHLCSELLKHPQLVEGIFLRSPGASREATLIAQRWLLAGKPIWELDERLYAGVSPVEESCGITALIRYPALLEEVPAGDIVCLEGVQDPGNLGTIFRTALACGLKCAAYTPGTAFPWAPKTLRAGMGAQFYMGFIRADSVSALKARTDSKCLVADARGGKSLWQTDWGEQPLLWVFGSEGAGVTEDALNSADERVLIPLEAESESLNVAIAASVCLFEQRRRRLKAH